MPIMFVNALSPIPQRCIGLTRTVHARNEPQQLYSRLWPTRHSIVETHR